MSIKKLTIAIALGTAACGLALGGGMAIANAATPNATPTPSSSSSSEGGRGVSADTVVTGDQAAKVTAAVKAKDSAVTITSVRKDPDGSYDALGTKAGASVMYDVSADLATITQSTGGHGGHGGGHGGAPATASPSAAAGA